MKNTLRHFINISVLILLTCIGYYCDTIGYFALYCLVLAIVIANYLGLRFIMNCKSKES